MIITSSSSFKRRDELPYDAYTYNTIFLVNLLGHLVRNSRFAYEKKGLMKGMMSSVASTAFVIEAHMLNVFTVVQHSSIPFPNIYFLNPCADKSSNTYVSIQVLYNCYTIYPFCETSV